MKMRWLAICVTLAAFIVPMTPMTAERADAAPRVVKKEKKKETDQKKQHQQGKKKYPWGEPNAAPGQRPGPDGEESPRLLALLDERLRFESLLARLSATFIHLPPWCEHGIENTGEETLEILICTSPPNP